MIFGLPSVSAIPAQNMPQPRLRGSAAAPAPTGARQIFHASQAR